MHVPAEPHRPTMFGEITTCKKSGAKRRKEKMRRGGDLGGEGRGVTHRNPFTLEKEGPELSMG